MIVAAQNDGCIFMRKEYFSWTDNKYCEGLVNYSSVFCLYTHFKDSKLYYSWFFLPIYLSYLIQSFVIFHQSFYFKILQYFMSDSLLHLSDIGSYLYFSILGWKRKCSLHYLNQGQMLPKMMWQFIFYYNHDLVCNNFYLAHPDFDRTLNLSFKSGKRLTFFCGLKMTNNLGFLLIQSLDNFDFQLIILICKVIFQVKQQYLILNYTFIS